MKENKSKLVASICKKLEAEGTDEELEYLREQWKIEERLASGLYPHDLISNNAWYLQDNSLDDGYKTVIRKVK